MKNTIQQETELTVDMKVDTRTRRATKDVMKWYRPHDMEGFLKKNVGQMTSTRDHPKLEIALFS